LKLFSKFKNQKTTTIAKYQMISDEGSGYFGWSGNLYRSDLIRSAIRPKVRAIGKVTAKHIRRDDKGLKVNPEPYIRFLLEEPNPFMTMQKLLEKVITQLELNNNAFIFVARDDNGYPMGLYPINSTSAQVVRDERNNHYYKFFITGGKEVTFRFEDVMHLAKDYGSSEYFGESNAEVLTPLMEIVTTSDQSIVKAIKNSNVIRWLLKWNQALRPEDLKKNAKDFQETFLSVDSEVDSIVATDSKVDATRIEPKDYVPSEGHTGNINKRVYAFFNTNEKIIHSTYTENEWISYYESVIEPDIIQLSTLFTKVLFSRKERAYGNRIMFESDNLAFASLKTKREYANGGIDRGYLNRNEAREIFNKAPIEGGDEYIRRLDLTQDNQADSKGGENNE